MSNDANVPQVPEAVLSLILQHLAAYDQASFRLTCRRWLYAHKLASSPSTIQIACAGDWIRTFKYVKHLAPRSVVTLHTHDHTEVIRLCHFAECHTIRLVLQAGSYWYCRSEPYTYFPDPLTKSLVMLEDVTKALQATKGKKNLEIAIRVRSGSTEHESGRMGLALQGVKANIVHLRFIETPYKVMASFFPFNSLQTLEIVLPKQGDQTLTQQAVQSLPLLRNLHVYTRNKIKRHAVVSFIQVLESMQKVTSFRIGLTPVPEKPLGLPSATLQHVTSLQMGSNITTMTRPAKLQKLRLQTLTCPQQAEKLAQQLQQSPWCTSLSIDEVSPQALFHLPASLQYLVLHARSEESLDFSIEDPDCSPLGSLNRFSQLRAVRLGCFLTSDLFEGLTGVCLPSLHTLGFQLPSAFFRFAPAQRVVERAGVFHIQPDPGVEQLGPVFPNIDTLSIRFQEGNALSGGVHGSAHLASHFMAHMYFRS